MSTASSQGRPLLGLILLLGIIPGCGARVGYGAYGGPDAGSPAPVDAGLGCAHLRELVPPTRIMGGDGLHYVYPHAIARTGGFDVVAFQNTLSSPVEPSLVGRRLRVDPGSFDEPPRLVSEEPVDLDPDTRTAASVATDGVHLGACYRGRSADGSSYPTFQTHGANYLPASARVQFPEYEGRCLALAGRPGRFRMFWLENGNRAPFAMLRVDLDPAGALLSEPADVDMDINSMESLEAVSYRGGFAWVSSSSHDAPIRVTLSAAGAPELAVDHVVTGSGGRHNDVRLASWPFADDTVAVLWETWEPDASGPPTTLALTTLSDSGAVGPITALPRRYPVGVIPLVAALPEGLVLMAAQYDDYGSINGRLRVSILDAAGQTNGPDVELQFHRGVFNNDWDFALAADEQHVLVVWSAELDSPEPGVWAAVLGCAD